MHASKLLKIFMDFLLQTFYSTQSWFLSLMALIVLNSYRSELLALLDLSSLYALITIDALVTLITLNALKNFIALVNLINFGALIALSRSQRSWHP